MPFSIYISETLYMQGMKGVFCQTFSKVSLDYNRSS